METMNPIESGLSGRKPILGSQHDRPVPLGTPVKALIERQARNPSTVTYSLEITVLEVLRGKGAMENIRKANLTDKDPDPGFEYLMARIRFRYAPRARGLSEYEPYEVEQIQFRALSHEGSEDYKTPQLKRQPDPGLIGISIDVNESREGWIIFQVPLDEKEPLLAFDRDATEGRLTLKTARGLLWFKLYDFDPMTLDCECVECARPDS
jgi:hypothetical protein